MGTIGLPLDLGAVGMTGCMLHVNGTIVLPVAISGGRGAQPLAIPSSPALTGGSFYNQALVADLPANAAGATASHAAEGKFGAR